MLQINEIKDFWSNFAFFLQVQLSIKRTHDQFLAKFDEKRVMMQIFYDLKIQFITYKFKRLIYYN